MTNFFTLAQLGGSSNTVDHTDLKSGWGPDPWTRQKLTPMISTHTSMSQIL